MTNYLIRRNTGLDLLDEALNGFFKPTSDSAMKTDVSEIDNAYLLEIELAGFSKNEIQLSFEKGYLTVSAKKETTDEKKETYLRKERALSLSRIYYVGDINKEGIKAKYENGILFVTLPKKEKEDPILKNILID